MARARAFRIPTSYSDTIPTNEVFVIERGVRKWVLSRRMRAYQRLENKMAASDDIDALDWVAGRWTASMIATTESWVLETRPFMKPNLDEQTRTKIFEELARRRVTRAQKEARCSIIIAIASMLVAAADWLTANS